MIPKSALNEEKSRIYKGWRKGKRIEVEIQVGAEIALTHAGGFGSWAGSRTYRVVGFAHDPDIDEIVVILQDHMGSWIDCDGIEVATALLRKEEE